MRFRKKLTKYPRKGQIVECDYPLKCRALILRVGRNKELSQKGFSIKVISMLPPYNEGRNSNYVNSEHIAYLSEFPKYRKTWEDYCKIGR